MKKRLLRIGSFLLALVVLFVSVGWDVKFHYCTEDHHLTGSFVDAASACVHCLGHHHDHEQEHEEADLPHDVAHFSAKCCCEDFDSKIQFTDNYVFSPEKHVNIQFLPFVFVHLDLQNLMPKAKQVFLLFTARKIPPFLSARDRLVFFSALKLDPLVF